MANGSEVEAKLTLSESDFYRLRERGRVVGQMDQLNIYYDSEGRLSALKATLRVRMSHGAAPVLTLKLPVRQNGSVRHAVEIETPLARGASILRKRKVKVPDEIPPEFTLHLSELAIHHLCRVGWMRTLRQVVRLPNRVTIELDHVRLPNGSQFFEVEIEDSDSKARDKAVRTIKRFAKSASPSLQSKFERFHEAMSTRLEKA